MSHSNYNTKPRRNALRLLSYCFISVYLLVFSPINMAYEQSSNNYAIAKDVLSNAGNASQSNNYQLLATAGESLMQTVANSNNTLYSGFYAPRQTRSDNETASEACGGITDGLVACYPFDGNANDESGNGNDGTVYGATLAQDRFGNANSAYDFDGIDDYIFIKNSDSMNPKFISISAWYFATKSFSGNGNNVIIHKPYIRHSPPHYQWQLGIGGNQYWRNNSDKFIFGGDVGISSGRLFFWSGKNIASLGAWYHVVTSFDGNVLKLYVNGKLERFENAPSFSEINEYATDIFIGKHGNLSRQLDYTPGIIDDISIYNRALTESEIKQLYTGKEEPCESELSVQPFYQVLQWWQRNTSFQLQNKTDCAMQWTTHANQTWLNVAPTSGTNDTTLNASMPLSLDFKVGSLTTTAPDSLNSPAHNIIIQPGLWWWWKYWLMQLFSGTIHPNQAIPHLIAINHAIHSPMIFKVTWPGSDLDLSITTPSGQILTKDSPEVLEVYEGDTEEFWVVESEEKGDWGVDVIAIEVDPEGEPYELSIIANERTEPPTEDADGDGLPDEWESYFFGDLSQDATGDIDNDGVSNLLEFQNNLNPAADNNDAKAIQNYTASGTLNDANGQPIAGATVQVGDLITTTDENGQWTLNGLTEAQHQLIISKAGYSFKPVTFVTSANTPATTVNVPAPQSALSVEIGRVPSLVEQGEPLLSYSTTVSNKGLETATNVTLQQSLSTGHENVVIDSSGSCNFDGATIQCQLVDIPANNSIVIDTHSTPNRDVQSLSTSAVVSSNYPESSDTLITKIYPHFRVNSWISPSETMLDAHAVLNLRITNGQYSPAIANDVTAVINLPNGVEFVSAELENGNCLHESNIVSCTLNPMPADTTESIKVTVKATHTGTQQIIVEADASNFDIVTATGKVMVNSPESELDKADVVFLIDTTGSMANDIQAVINALVQLVNELDEQKAPKVGIILFKDEITDSIVTDDLNAIIDLLQNIKVSGGDEIYFCPENAVSAMNKAVNLINDNGRIILATDASYHPDTSSADAEDIMQDKNVAFDVLLSGDCVNSRNTRRDNTSCDLSAAGEILSAETVYHCLADATGGTFTYIEDIKSGSTEAMTQYVDQLLSLLQVVVQQVNIDDEPEEDVKGDGKGSDDGNKENIILVDPETKTYLAPPQADSFWVFVGSPNGHVVSKPAGIDCNKGYGQCFYYFKRGTKLELIPTAPEGLYFDSWYGDVGCEDGKFTVTGMKACSAIFYGIPKP